MKRALAVAAFLMLVGCGGKSDITIQGSLVAEGTQCFLQPEPNMAHKQVTFRDGNGAVIGTTTTGDVTGGLDLTNGTPCKETAPFTVSLPKADFYQASIEGIQVQAQPISYADLQARGFHLDLSITSS